MLSVRKFLPKRENLKILDVGCGKGHISVLLASLGYSVYGIDIEETKGEQLEILEKKWQQNMWRDFEKTYPLFHLNYQFYDGRKIPFHNGTFDAVMAYAVIEHVTNPREFLREINRVLKKGGYLFMFRCPRKQALIEYAAGFLKLPRHERLMGKKELIELLKINGFKEVKMENSDLIPSFPPLKLQKLWNANFEVLDSTDRILLNTPVGYFAHHFNIICNKV